jgi:hypothetical protein
MRLRFGQSDRAPRRDEWACLPERRSDPHPIAIEFMVADEEAGGVPAVGRPRPRYSQVRAGVLRDGSRNSRAMVADDRSDAGSERLPRSSAVH